MKGRYAPSPTGALHLGNASTALLAWLDARAAAGTIALRIEDLDVDRIRPGAEARLLDELGWLGLDFDGPIVRQSERTELYLSAVERLIADGLAFPCFCSRAEVRAAASAPHGPGDDGPRYPGTCRDLPQEEVETRRAAGRKPSIRFRTDRAQQRFGGEVVVRDLLLGEQRQDVDAVVGDFVIRRADGVFAYQLAVVVDDGEMAITRVVRGADLLDSTPRQVLLHAALGTPVPEHLHAPLVVGPDGIRLSKRHGAVSLAEHREGGKRPEELVGFLAHAAGLLDENRPVHPRELVAAYDRDRLHRSR